MKLYCPRCKVDYFSKTANVNFKHYPCGEYGVTDWKHKEEDKEEEHKK